MAEQRSFQIHAKILHDAIFRQAGTLSKAILEAVMNSVDAKATYCHVTLTGSSVKVDDDGIGFKSKEEIAQNFEIFGLPHDESEQKTYGRFRMGRGQGFGYGVNTWTTNKLQMVVDVKAKGLSYELSELKKSTPGCHIEIVLYEPIMQMTQRSVEDDLHEWCKWAPIPVTLNGASISTNPADVKDWTQETDTAWFKLGDRQELKVYNRGIHVQTFHRSKFGIGGDVISKPALEVNFARNEIMSSCPHWGQIKPILDRAGVNYASKQESLNDGDRLGLLKRFIAGSLDKALYGAQFITAVTGRHYAVDRVGDARFGYRISFAPHGSPIGDRLHRQKSAFIISEKMLTDSRLSEAKFFELLKNMWASTRQGDRTLLPFSQLAATVKSNYVFVPEKKYRSREAYWIALLETANTILTRGVAKVHAKLDTTGELTPRSMYETFRETSKTERRLVVGEGPATGWTDGATYIAINREYLAKSPLDLDGYLALGTLLIHEYCHLVPDHEAHDHDQAFYESFHDLCRESLGDFTKKVLQQAPMVAARVGRKLSRAELAVQDQADRARDSTTKLMKQVSTRASS